MTPKEIQAELNAIQKDVGSNAYVSLDVNTGAGKPVSAVLYPYGITHSDEGYLRIAANSFREVIDDLWAAWVKFRDEHKTKVTRKMALAIIRITADFGACTDAALRGEFDAAEISRCGADACVMANEMAGKGPFSILTTTGANGAPDHIEAGSPLQ